MTTNVIIAFGGVALLGLIGAVVASVAGAAAQRKEPPAQTGHEAGTQPSTR